jgi:hypothetical protein
MGETEQGQKASAAQDLWEKGVKRFPQSVLLHCEVGFYHLDTSDYALFQKQVDEARKLKEVTAGRMVPTLGVSMVGSDLDRGHAESGR